MDERRGDTHRRRSGAPSSPSRSLEGREPGKQIDLERGTEEILLPDYQPQAGDGRSQNQPAMDVLLDLRVDRAPRAVVRSRPSRLRPVLRSAADVVANSAVALGVLFLLNAGGLGLGMPEGGTGLLAGLALVTAGLAAILVPARIRRRERWSYARAVPIEVARASSRRTA